MTIPVITLDGPSASGKGTVAARIATRLGFHYLDSGALYRLLGLSLHKRELLEKLDAELEKCAEIAANLDIKFVTTESGVQVLLDGQDVTQTIRTERVGEFASKVAAIPVRAAATGGHSNLAGISRLLPAAYHQGAKNAHAHRQGRRGQKPHWAGHALTAGRQHEYHQHPEGGEQPVQPCGLGKQAPDGGRRYGHERLAQDQLYQIHRHI